MRRSIALVSLLAVVVAVAACGGSSRPAAQPAKHSALAVVDKADVGPVLVDGQGRTLYRYARDRRGRSTCTGTCAQSWPPATIGRSLDGGDADVDGVVGTTTRPDGTEQLSFDGMPLYRFAQDTTAADAKGQGAEHVWFVVRARGSKPATSAPAPAEPKSSYGY